MIDATYILTLAEIQAVLDDLKRRARRSINSRQNLILFRLVTCCGLRAGEICGLRVTDLHHANSSPYLEVRQQLHKGVFKPPKGSRNGRNNVRRVPIFWDQGTLADLKAWTAHRIGEGARPLDPYVRRRYGTTDGWLDSSAVFRRFRVACRRLGPERCREIHPHTGRHCFVSYMLQHHNVVEVQRAAGHASLATTSLYAHIIPTDNEPGSVF